MASKAEREEWDKEFKKKMAAKERKMWKQYLVIILIGLVGLVVGVAVAVLRGCPPAIGVICVAIAR